MIKSNIDDLAIFSGLPTFEKCIHVGRPNIGNRERFLYRVNRILDNKWLTNNGEFVKEFERRLEKYLGVKHCIAVCNGTIGLQILLKALDIKGEVIVPSFTFIATIHALKWLSIEPYFSDIEQDTHNIDPKKIQKLINHKTTAILGVHLWGRPCDIDYLSYLSIKNDIKLIFDAAHGFGSSYKGRKIGNFGDAEVFSFHATKILNTFEGGAITTNNDKLAKKIRLMKNFGFKGTVISLGTNGKMSEISAAMGITNLESIDSYISKSQDNYSFYMSKISNIPGIKIIRNDEYKTSNCQYVTVEIDETVTKIDRDQICNILQAENILVKRYFYPSCHMVEPYIYSKSRLKFELPVTEKLSKHVITLPSGTSIGQREIIKISEVLKFIVNNGEKITKKFQNTI